MTLDEALQQVGDNIITDAKHILKKQGHIASSNLYNSMKSKVVGSSLTFDLPKYAKYVDEGRKPGKYAPPESIEEWCKTKGIDSKFAFVINKKIFEKGIKPSLFFTDSYEENTENLDDILDAYMDGLMDDIIG